MYMCEHSQKTWESMHIVGKIDAQPGNEVLHTPPLKETMGIAITHQGNQWKLYRVHQAIFESRHYL